MQCLAAGASRGERWERTARGLPGVDRAKQRKPCLLGDIAAVATAWQVKPGYGRADQRLVAAQELLQGSTLMVLHCSEQRVFLW